MGDILYIQSDDDSYPSLNKRHYLERAITRLGLSNVKNYWTHGSDPVEYLLNIEPYYRHTPKGSKWNGLWEIDCLINRERKERYWTEDIDTVFMANTTHTYPITGKRVLLLQACDADLYNDVWKIEKKYDFVLCGNMSDMWYYKDFGETECASSNDIYAERARVIGQLRKKYDFHFYEPHRPPQEYLKLQAEGRIQFIRSMKVMGEGEIAQRFFELLPLGPVITNDAPDIPHLGLIEGEDFMVYHDDEEMFAKMDLLVKDELLRNKIARNGREKAFQYHTYENRLLYILSYLKRNYGFKM